MSQPQSVPVQPVSRSHYESPPRRDREWTADRPGDVFVAGQPEGDLFGSQGPDQGFALRLAKHFDDDLVLADGERRADVVAGCVAIALKRASAFGRAPTIHDLRCAFSIFGFLNADSRTTLVAVRSEMFEEVAHPHHYAQRRAIVDAVPVAFLKRPHQEVLADAVDPELLLASLQVD